MKFSISKKNITTVAGVIIALLLLSTFAQSDVVIIDFEPNNLQPGKLVFNASGQKVLIGCTGSGYNLMYVDAATGEVYEQVSTDPNPSGVLTSPKNIIALYNHGLFVASNFWLDTVSFIDMDTAEVIDTLDVGDYPRQLSAVTLLTPDPQPLVAVLNIHDNSISYIDPTVPEVLDTVSFITGETPNDIVWKTEDLKAYISCIGSDTVVIHTLSFDGGFDVTEESIDVDEWPSCLALTDNGSAVVVGCSVAGVLQFIETIGDTLLPNTIDVGQYIASLDTLPAPNRILLSQYNDPSDPENSSRVVLVDTAANQIIDTLSIPDCQITLHDFLPFTSIVGYTSYITHEIILVDTKFDDLIIFAREPLANGPGFISAHPFGGRINITSNWYANLNIVTVDAPNQCPEVEIIPPGPIYLQVDEALQFLAFCSDPDNDPIVYSQWDFDDGTIIEDACNSGEVHWWNEPGEYLVVLSAFDGQCWGYDEAEVIVTQ